MDGRRVAMKVMLVVRVGGRSCEEAGRRDGMQVR